MSWAVNKIQENITINNKTDFSLPQIEILASSHYFAWQVIIVSPDNLEWWARTWSKGQTTSGGGENHIHPLPFPHTTYSLWASVLSPVEWRLYRLSYIWHEDWILSVWRAHSAICQSWDLDDIELLRSLLRDLMKIVAHVYTTPSNPFGSSGIWCFHFQKSHLWHLIIREIPAGCQNLLFMPG